jgi:hypothetical protein
MWSETGLEFGFSRPNRIQSPEIVGLHSQAVLFTPVGKVCAVVATLYSPMSDWLLATCW